MASDKELTHIRVLRSFRGPTGAALKIDSEHPKTDFEKADWSNLCNMSPPKAEECAPSAKKAAEVATKLPGQ